MSTTHRIPGAVLTEREHVVPSVHSDPQRGRISVFTREVAAPDGGDRPYLVFLQGGPGFEASRRTSPPSGWQACALADFRALLLDQRGTGRSTPARRVRGLRAWITNEYAHNGLRADGERIVSRLLDMVRGRA